MDHEGQRRHRRDHDPTEGGDEDRVAGVELAGIFEAESQRQTGGDGYRSRDQQRKEVTLIVDDGTQGGKEQGPSGHQQQGSHDKSDGAEVHREITRE